MQRNWEDLASEGGCAVNAKTYLDQIAVMEHRIESRIAMLADLKAMAEKTNSIISDVVVCHSRNNHAMEDVIVRITEMKEQIAEDFHRLLDLKKEILERIQAIPDPKMQQVLELRYVSYQSWDAIAEKMDCTRSCVYKLHVQALRAIKVPE